MCTIPATASKMTASFQQKKNSKSYLFSGFSRTRSGELYAAHSLAFPPGWGDLPAHFMPVNIINYWKECKEKFTDDSEFLTLGEVIAQKLMDPSQLLPISHQDIVTYLSNFMDQDNALVKYTDRSLHVRWSQAILTLTYMSQYFADQDISNIEKYNKLVEYLCKCDLITSKYITKLCIKYFDGPVESLASSVDLKNVRFVMRKAKLANSIPLISQLFKSPTWRGKLTAIIRLIELFDIDIFKASTELINKLASYILKIAAWVMQKSSVAKDLVEQKCGWVKAEDEEKVELQANPQCGCGRPTNRGCSFCGQHVCFECELCICPEEYHHNADNCACTSPEDCLWDALGQASKMTTYHMKNLIHVGLEQPALEKKYKTYVQHYYNDFALSFEEAKKICKNSLKWGIQAEIESVILAHLILEKNFQIITSDQVRHAAYSKCASWLNIRFTPGHYFYQGDGVYTATHHLTGIACIGFNHPENYVTEIQKIELTPIPEMSPPITPPEPVIESTPSKYGLNYKSLSEAFDLCSESGSDTSSSSDYVNRQIQRLEELSQQIHSEDKDPEVQKAEREAAFTDVELPKGDSSFFNLFSKFSSDEFTSKFQSWFCNLSKNIILWFENNPLITGIFAILSGIAQFCGFYMAMPTSRTGVQGLVQKFSAATRTMHYTRNGFKGIMESVKDVFGVCKDMLGVASNAPLQEFKVEVAEAMVECRDLLVLAQSNPGEIINSSEKYYDFRKKFLTMSDKYVQLVKCTETKELAILTPVWHALSKVYYDLTHIYTKFVNCMNSRQVPVCIYLWGTTGVGKSSVLTHLTNALNKKMGTQMSTYTISKGNIHWNNFAGHAIIRIDDLNAQMNPAEGDIDSLNLFNLITDAPFIPMQAAIPDKGVMAAPRFVIVAANEPTLPANSTICDVKAWERRRHLCVRVTWPEHEEKCKGNDQCEHMVGKKLDNFDHLTFSLCDPVMSEQHSVVNKVVNSKTGNTYNARKITTKDLASISGSSTNVTFNDIVDLAVDLEAKHRRNFKVAFDAAVKAGTMKLPVSLQSPVEYWDNEPILAIEGVPGTGKSYIFKRVQEKFGDRCLFLNTKSAFALWKNGGYVAPNKDIVIIDDVSTIVNDEELWNSFSDLIKDTYNQCKTKTYNIVFGFNRLLLEEKFGEETVQQIFRRVKVIRSFFKDKPIGMQMLARLRKQSPSYTYEDVRMNNELPERDREPMDKFVDYQISPKKFFTQETLVSVICNFQPKLTQVSSINEISRKTHVNMTCMCRLKISAAELTNVLNKSNIRDVIKLTMSASMNTLKGSKITLTKFGDIISKITKKAKNMKGTSFVTFEDLLLQAWNAGLLEDFKGECVTLFLNDIVYYIDYVSELDVGKLDIGAEEVAELVSSLKVVTSISTEQKIESITSTLFPPWFILASDIFLTIFSIISPGVSALLAIQDQDEMYKAYEAYSSIADVVEQGTETAMVNAKNKLSKAVGLEVHKSIVNPKNKLYPGMAYIKKPQNGYVEDLPADVFQPPKNLATDFESPSDAPRSSARSYWSTTTPSQKQCDVVRESPSDTSSTRSGSAARHYYDDPIQFGSVDSKTVPTKEYFDRPFNDPTARMGPISETSAGGVTFQSTQPDKKKKEAVFQMATDPSLYPIISHILPNMCEVLNENGIRLCSGLFVRGRVCRTMLHLEEGSNIERLFIRTCDGKTWPTKVLYINEKTDRLDLKIEDPLFQPKIDISKHFPSMANDIQEGKYAVLVTPKFNVLKEGVAYYMRSYMIKHVDYHNFNSLNRSYHVIDYRGHRAGYMMDGPVQTTLGDCGSVLILADPHANHGKVIGLHMAGTPRIGYASPLYKEQYEDKVQFQSLKNNSKFKESFFCSKPIDSDAIAATPYNLHVPKRSKLYRNIIPLGPEVYEPSVLSDGDPRATCESVMLKESKKWLGPRPQFSDEQKKEMKDLMLDISQYFIAQIKSEGINLKKLTNQQALNKYQMSQHSEPINVHTSPGFPWNLDTKVKGKFDYISVDEDGIRHFNKDNQKKFDRLHNEVNKLIDPVIFEKTNKGVLFQVFLKDEPVKKKKIYEDTRTRTIAAAPLDFQIAFRRYFHTAHCAVMDCWHKLPIKVGLNPLSLDWHTLFTSLSKVSMQALDLDYKGWDFSGNPYFTELMCLFWKTLFQNLDPTYTPEDDVVRDNLYSLICNFYFLTGNQMFQSTGGIPSGYPGTTPDNSLINFFMIAYSYIQIMKRKNPRTANFSSFLEDVAVACYGDDIVMSISKWALQFFNGLTIPSELAKLGYEAQPADKEGDFLVSKPLKECIFLSRHFKFTSGFWIAPLQIDHLLKPTHWVHDRRSHDWYKDRHAKCRSWDIISSAYDSVLYDASLHSDAIFNKVRSACLEIYEMCGIKYPMTKQECLSRLFGSDIRIGEVIGLSFFDLKHLINKYVHPGRPHFFKKFHNRVTIKYGVNYTYAHDLTPSNKIPKVMQKLLDEINREFSKSYNSILVNEYPVGGEIPYHKDDEEMLDQSEGVLGLTIFGDGMVNFKQGTKHIPYLLAPGVAYLMEDKCLTDWSHSRDSHSRVTISYTFRKMKVPQN